MEAASTTLDPQRIQVPPFEPAERLRASTGPAPRSSRRAADVLVDLLAEAGVDVVFGLPGGVISPVHDALLDSRIRCVTTRHESGALFAAAGYAHTTGKRARARSTP
jgi:acetolactate synthase-1/2/3 large subunit